MMVLQFMGVTEKSHNYPLENMNFHTDLINILARSPKIFCFNHWTNWLFVNLMKLCMIYKVFLQRCFSCNLFTSASLAYIHSLFNCFCTFVLCLNFASWHFFYFIQHISFTKQLTELQKNISVRADNHKPLTPLVILSYMEIVYMHRNMLYCSCTVCVCCSISANKLILCTCSRLNRETKSPVVVFWEWDKSETVTLAKTKEGFDRHRVSVVFVLPCNKMFTRKELVSSTEQSSLWEIPFKCSYYALVIILPQDISKTRLLMQSSCKWKYSNCTRCACVEI